MPVLSGGLITDATPKDSGPGLVMRGQVSSKDNCYESGLDFQRSPGFPVVTSRSPAGYAKNRHREVGLCALYSGCPAALSGAPSITGPVLPGPPQLVSSLAQCPSPVLPASVH